MKKKSLSWGWIIFWCIIFWPVGLFLVFRKLSTDKSALMSGKTTSLTVTAWVLIVIGLALMVDESESTSAVLGLAFIIGGAVLLYKGSQIKKKAAKYRKYINLIVNQNVTSVDHITSAVNSSYDVVFNDLQNMIESGYLSNAYIHQGKREVILKDSEPTPVLSNEPSINVQRNTVVNCTGCGAKNVLTTGMVSECEYCGTPIHA